MRKWFYIFALVLLACLSCKRMPLYDLELKKVILSLTLDLKIELDIDVDVDVDVEVEKTIKMPEHNKVLFYHPDNGQLLNSEFVGPTGGAISTSAGTYQMVVYSFGTEYTQIRGEGNIETLEAFTSDITATKSAALYACTRAIGDEPQGPIIYAPDHLLVAREYVVIPEQTMDSQEIVVYASCKTIVETYSFEVHSVVGAEYIESCEAFVTNQARSSFFGLGKVSQQPATLSFPVGVNRKKGYLYTTFNTFGKLPGESRSFLHILIRDTGGKEHHFSTDITDQFEKPDNHIVIEEEIDIPKPESSGGGIAPTVEQWDEEIHDVPIG